MPSDCLAPIRRYGKTILKAAACLVVTAAIALVGHAAQPSDDKDRKKLAVLKHEISALQKQLRHTDSERGQQAEKLRKTEQKAAQIQQALRKLDLEVGALDTDLAGLADKKKILEIDKRKQAEMVARELSAAYRLGRQEPLKLLFNLENPDKVGRMLRYYQYMITARSDVLSNFKNTLSEIASVEAELLAKQGKLKESQAAFVTASDNLKMELDERKNLLATITRQAVNEKTRLSTLELEKRQLEKLIAKLEENIRNLSIPSDTPFVTQRGKLPWPVTGTVQHGFGATRNTSLVWSGWLLSAREASPVKAIHHGRVVFSDYLRGHGLMLIIDHGGGYLSLYAHNQMLLKEIGDWVTGGEDIARVGNTGGLAQSALYFEIRNKGKPVDPKTWLQPRK